MPPSDDPVPPDLILDLNEAFRVLDALEDSLLMLEDAEIALGFRDELTTVIRLLHGRLGSASTILREASMATAEPLRATEAARVLGVPTRDLLRLIHERKIRFVMVDGIAHVPTDAIREYRATAS